MNIPAAAFLLLVWFSFPAVGSASESTLPVVSVPPRSADEVSGSSAGTPPPAVRGAAAPGQPPASAVAPPPAAPVPASVPSRVTPPAQAAIPAPPSDHSPDRVLSPGDVDLQVAKNLDAEEDGGAERGLGEEFFDNASREVEKGKAGIFSGIASPIEKFIRYFQTAGRKKFELYLSRSGKYAGMMQKILARYGLPEDLVYIALIESGFSPKAYSVAKAAGPWQFISETGRRYGLRIDWWADERRDAEKSTHAAASYLRDLYGMFESWPLAAAAYNAGEGKIQRAVTRYRSDDFNKIIRYRFLKQETKDYVPKMLAALTIAKDPEKYGFGDVAYEAPLDLRVVSVPGGTDLATVARIVEVPVESVREWNPELRRFCTPPNRERYDLRLSAAAAARAEERMDQIRTEGKVTFLQHYVRRAETLAGLAQRYRTSVAVIKEMNGLKRDSLSRTARLIIPVTGLSGEEAPPGAELSPEQLTMAHMRAEKRARNPRRGPRLQPFDTITVRRGDTLSRLAKRHRVPVKELAKANGLSLGAKLRVGARLALPGAGEPRDLGDAAIDAPEKAKAVKAASAAGRSKEPRKRTTRYKVHKGDTLDQIARVYGVTVDRLAERNRLKKTEPLRAGVRLVIPLES